MKFFSEYSLIFIIFVVLFVPQISLAQALDEVDGSIMSTPEERSLSPEERSAEAANNVSKSTTKQECEDKRARTKASCEAELKKTPEPTSDQRARCVLVPDQVYADCMKTVDPATTGAAPEQEYQIPKAEAAALNQFQGQTAQQVVGNMLATATKIMGSIAFAMMVFAGLLWMTAAGNSDKQRKAQDIMIWSALGVIVILSSYSLVKLVFDAFA